MSARNTRDSRRPRTRIEHLEGESAEFKAGLSVDRVLPSKSTSAYGGANAIVFINDANCNADNEDIGFLIDDERIFTKRQLLQTDGERLVIHAAANLELVDNYAVTANLRVDFVEAMDAGKITFNDTLGAAAIQFDVDNGTDGATTTGANVVGEGSLRFSDATGAFAHIDGASVQVSTSGGGDFILEDSNASLSVPLKVDNVTEFQSGQGVTFGWDRDFTMTLNNDDTAGAATRTELTAEKKPLLLTGDSLNAGATGDGHAGKAELLLAEGNVASDSMRLSHIYAALDGSGKSDSNAGIELLGDSGRVSIKNAEIDSLVMQVHDTTPVVQPMQGTQFEAEQMLVLRSGAGDGKAATIVELNDGFVATKDVKADAIEPLTSNTAGIRLGTGGAAGKFGVTINEGSWTNHGNSAVDLTAGTLLTFQDKAMIVAPSATAGVPDTHIGMAEGVVDIETIKVSHILEGGIDGSADEDRQIIIGSGTSRSTLRQEAQGSVFEIFTPAGSDQDAANLNVLKVNGQLQVTGNLTYVDSVTLQVDDRNVQLGFVDAPTNLTAEGGGLELMGAQNKRIYWHDDFVPKTHAATHDPVADTPVDKSEPGYDTIGRGATWYSTEKVAAQEFITGEVKSIYANSWVGIEDARVQNGDLYINAIRDNGEAPNLVHIGYETAANNTVVDVDYVKQSINHLASLQSHGTDLDVHAVGIDVDASSEYARFKSGDLSVQQKVQSHTEVLFFHPGKKEDAANPGQLVDLDPDTEGSQLWFTAEETRMVQLSAANEYTDFVSTNGKGLRFRNFTEGADRADILNVGVATDCAVFGYEAGSKNVSNLSLMVDQISERSGGNGVLIESALVEGANISFATGMTGFLRSGSGDVSGEADADGMSLALAPDGLSLGSEAKDYNYLSMADGDDSRFMAQEGNIELMAHHGADASPDGSRVVLANQYVDLASTSAAGASAGGRITLEAERIDVSKVIRGHANAAVELYNAQFNQDQLDLQTSAAFAITVKDGEESALKLESASNVFIQVDSRAGSASAPAPRMKLLDHTGGLVKADARLSAHHLYGLAEMTNVPYVMNVEAHVFAQCPPASDGWDFNAEDGSVQSANNAAHAASPHLRFPFAFALLMGTGHEGTDGFSSPPTDCNGIGYPTVLNGSISTTNTDEWGGVNTIIPDFNVMARAPANGYVSRVDLFCNGADISSSDRSFRFVLLRCPRSGPNKGKWYPVLPQYLELRSGATEATAAVGEAGFVTCQWEGDAEVAGHASVELGWKAAASAIHENAFVAGDDLAFGFHNMVESEITMRARITFSSLGLNYDVAQSEQVTDGSLDVVDAGTGKYNYFYGGLDADESMY